MSAIPPPNPSAMDKNRSAPFSPPRLLCRQTENVRIASNDMLKHFVDEPTSVEAVKELTAQISLPELVQQLFNPQVSPTSEKLIISSLEKALSLPSVAVDFLSLDQQGLDSQRFRDAILMYGVRAPSVEVRKFLVQQIRSLSDLGASVRESSHSMVLSKEDRCSVLHGLLRLGLVEALSTLLLDDELAIATDSAKAIGELLKTDHTSVVECIQSKEFMDPHVQYIKTGNDLTKQLRVYQQYICLGSVSSHIFKFSERHFYEPLVALYCSDDLLLKLNVVELIEELSCYPLGIDWLSQREVLSTFLQDIRSDSIMTDTERIRILRVFANIIKRCPSRATELLTGADGVIPKTIKEFLRYPRSDSSSVAARLCAINSWGTICATPNGISHMGSETSLASDVSDASGDVSDAICCAALAAWSAVLTAIPLNELPEQIAEMAEKRVLPQALSLARRRPFADIREQLYELLHAMAPYQFTATTICLSKDDLAMLLDPRTDASYRISRHNFFSSLLKHHREWMGRQLKPEMFKYIENYVSNGPYQVVDEPPIAATMT